MGWALIRTWTGCYWGPNSTGTLTEPDKCRFFQAFLPTYGIAKINTVELVISTFVALIPFLSLCYSHPPITPDDDSDYAIYVVIYTFATIGGVLVITIFFLIIAILVVRHRKNTKGDPPLLSEEQKIAVMKQTGYVNPTYKFFDQTVESWVLLYWLCTVHCMYVQPSLNFFCLIATY